MKNETYSEAFIFSLFLNIYMYMKRFEINFKGVEQNVNLMTV